MDHVFQLPIKKSTSSPKVYQITFSYMHATYVLISPVLLFSHVLCTSHFIFICMKQRGRATSPSSFPPSPINTNTSLSASIVQSPSRRFSSPARKSVQYGDRFIPSRVSSNLEDAFDIMDQRQSPAGTPDKKTSPGYSNNGNVFNDSASSSYRDTTSGGQSALNNLIRSELLGHQVTSSPSSGSSIGESRNDSAGTLENMFKFNSPSSSRCVICFIGLFACFFVQTPSSLHVISLWSYYSSSGSYSVYGGGHSPYINSHDSPSSNAFMPMSAQGKAHFSQVKATRKIPKVPFKILDAPALQDDFYLNLVDWSSSNLLAVGLASSVYLWSACTSKVSLP